MIELQITPHDVIANHPEARGLAYVVAATVRAERKGIVRQATGDDPSHGNLTGPDTKGIQRRLAASAEWEIEPEGDT